MVNGNITQEFESDDRAAVFMIYLKKRQYLFTLFVIWFLLSSCSQFSKSDSEEKPALEPELFNIEPLETKNPGQFLPESITRREGAIAETLHQPFSQFVLENGLRVKYLHNPALPTISIALVVDAGKYQFNGIDERLSPLVLKLLRQGARQYSKKEFQRQVSLLGKPFQYRQTAQFSIISAEILSQDLEHSLNLLSQQLTEIKPDSGALKKVIEQQLLENKLTKSSGAYLAKRLFYQENYPPEHLYFQHQDNSDEIKSVKKDELLRFYRRQYRPEKSLLILSGDLESKILKNQVKRFFESNKFEQKQAKLRLKPLANKKRVKNRPNNTSVNKNKSQFNFIERKGARQVDLLYGMVTVPRRSSDWLGLKIIAALLGGGPDSRLFSDLREKQGLAYYLSAQQLDGRYSSPFFIKTSVAHNKLIPMIKGINRHIRYLCHNKIKPYELLKIKQQLRGEIVFKQQTNRQRLNNIIKQYENSLEDNYLITMKEEIRKITSEQLFDIANKYLCGTHTIIAVGQSNKLKKNFQNEFKDSIYHKY